MPPGEAAPVGPILSRWIIYSYLTTVSTNTTLNVSCEDGAVHASLQGYVEDTQEASCRLPSPLSPGGPITPSQRQSQQMTPRAFAPRTVQYTASGQGYIEDTEESMGHLSSSASPSSISTPLPHRTVAQQSTVLNRVREADTAWVYDIPKSNWKTTKGLAKGLGDTDETMRIEIPFDVNVPEGRLTREKAREFADELRASKDRIRFRVNAVTVDHQRLRDRADAYTRKVNDFLQAHQTSGER